MIFLENPWYFTFFDNRRTGNLKGLPMPSAAVTPLHIRIDRSDIHKYHFSTMELRLTQRYQSGLVRVETSTTHAKKECLQKPSTNVTKSTSHGKLVFESSLGSAKMSTVTVRTAARCCMCGAIMAWIQTLYLERWPALLYCHLWYLIFYSIQTRMWFILGGLGLMYRGFKRFANAQCGGNTFAY